MKAWRELPAASGAVPDRTMLRPGCLVIPFMEGGTIYNAINFNISLNNSTGGGSDQWTALMTINNTWLCPSDDNFQGVSDGFRSSSGVWGNYPNGNSPNNPFTNQPETRTPISNYAGSFGDNYAIGTADRCSEPVGNLSLPAHTPAGTVPRWLARILGNRMG